MRFNGELVSPERGMTETLPWGAVRVRGRNRPDTVSNPSVYNVSFALVGQAMVDWFGRWWVTEVEEGSIPFETGIGWAQVVSNPSYQSNTGRRANVTMQLEIECFASVDDDCQIITFGEIFGDSFTQALNLLERGINGS